MKIAYLLSSLSRANGGVSESVRRLAQSLQATRLADVTALGLQDSYSADDVPRWNPVPSSCFPVKGPRALGYAPALARALAETNPDVVHVAGLWMYPSIASRRWSLGAKRPYLISPHGMLDSWALNNSAWKKRLAALAYERDHLEHAACLHALCESEAQAIRAYGLKNPICVLPNGVDLPDASTASRAPVWAGRFPASRRVLLFLGRIHPKKGLGPLVQAWDALRNSDWQLVVVGWDQGGFQQELESKVRELKLADRVTFCGPLHGAEKIAAYRAAHAFVLPSFSEGLPMTILEAWAYGLPVLMTPACNLPEGFAAGAALEIAPDPDKLVQTLLLFTGMNEADRVRVGQRGRILVEQHFNWSQIAPKMLEVYQWITGCGSRPACVQI